MTTSTQTIEERPELTDYEKLSGFQDLIEQPEFKDSPPVTYTGAPDSLSVRLMKHGEKLTDFEASIVDAAQTLRKEFQHGVAINRRLLGRVVMRYHGELGNYKSFKAATKDLDRRGICRIEVAQFRLIKYVDRQENIYPSRFSKLVDDQRLIDILVACRNCVGAGFETCQNAAPRAAVQSLSMARYGISRNYFKKQIRELFRLGILEEVGGKGGTAFRVTSEATQTMKRPLKETPLAGLPQPLPKPVLAADDELTPLANALVATATADADVDQIEMGYLWQSFQKQGHTFQEFRRAIGELVACERARLLEANTGGNAVCHLELTGTDRNVPISFAMRSIAPAV